MKLLVGLGNPGQKYQKNRHNIGFLQVEQIAEYYQFGSWKVKFQAKCAEGRIGSHRVLALLPQTFMNLSGQSVAEAAKFYKIPLSDILVIHDELDLASGTLKMKQGGGAAGHNGLRSISQHMGEDYRRLRFGIGHPGDKSKVHNWVLGDFGKQEWQDLEPVMTAICAEAEALYADQAGYFTSQIAQRLKPNQRKDKKTSEKSSQIDSRKQKKTETTETSTSPFAILGKLKSSDSA